MRIIKITDQNEVWEHWYKTEKNEQYKRLKEEELRQKILNWRDDIKKPLPNNLNWYLAEIEIADIDKIYIISSDDWNDISKFTFLAKSVSENFNNVFLNQDSIRISDNIKNKVSFLSNGGEMDTKFILVTDNIYGPYTILEGNKRTVTLLYLNKLIGTNIYLGVSERIKDYIWARYMYRFQF